MGKQEVGDERAAARAALGRQAREGDRGKAEASPRDAKDAEADEIGQASRPAEHARRARKARPSLALGVHKNPRGVQRGGRGEGGEAENAGAPRRQAQLGRLPPRIAVALARHAKRSVLIPLFSFLYSTQSLCIKSFN